ncbi:MAG TPA: tryptophan 2,3-dioxygenase family protein [Terriglobales bacterium]|nr:tryptophan 2,3-dioxygenase family protein [Terriglobales bacterium]
MKQKSAPKPHAPLVAQNREMTQPILPGTAATDYERYLRTDELLALQKSPEQRSHPDELMFQLVHQASELVLKGTANELDRARESIVKGDYVFAVKLMDRSFRLLDRAIELLHVLETLTPYEYHVIRAGLGHGSGLDSPGFLSLLHLAPRLGQAFFDQLDATGIGLRDLYRRHAEFLALHEVAEQLLDFDERVQLFRFHHMKLAHRIIGGDVLGTTGRPVDILRQRQEHVLYKELWEVRNEITAEVNAKTKMEQQGHGRT